MSAPKIFVGITEDDLRQCAGDILPKDAKIWYASLHKQSIAANTTTRYGILCYYEFKKRFYGLMLGRIITSAEPTPWKRENFMFKNSKDERWSLTAELQRAKLRRHKPDEKTIVEGILELMVNQEKEWQSLTAEV